MAFTRSMDVGPEILNNTHCDSSYECLSGEDVCDVEPFVDRDLELLRCKDERACAFKRNYNGQFICSCPVNRATYGFN